MLSDWPRRTSDRRLWTAQDGPEAPSWEQGVIVEKQRKSGKFPDEVRERVVRLVRESEGSHGKRWGGRPSTASMCQSGGVE